MFYLNSPIYTIGTPEADSGLSTIVFYHPKNEVIRKCLWFSYHLFTEGNWVRGGGGGKGSKCLRKIQAFKAENN